MQETKKVGREKVKTVRSVRVLDREMASGREFSSGAVGFDRLKVEERSVNQQT